MNDQTPQLHLADAAGQAQSGPNQNQLDAMVALQKEEAKNIVRVQRVNVAFQAMAHLNEHVKSVVGGSLQDADAKLWDLCVETITQFIKTGS